MVDVNPGNAEVEVNKPLPTPREVAQKRVIKEENDCEATLDSIADTMRGILAKKEKLANTLDKDRKKLYKKQLKNSKKYVKSLLHSLELELWEYSEAEHTLEKL